MARSRKSQTKVGLNSKLSAVDLLTLKYDGAAAFAEGAPVAIGSDGAAALPTDGAASTDALCVNFVDSARNDVIDYQGDAFGDLPSVAISDSGKITGIIGRQTLIGLPKECWKGGALPTVGHGVFADVTASVPTWEAAAIADNLFYYGKVLYIADNRAWFLFSSTPTMLADDDIA